MKMNTIKARLDRLLPPRRELILRSHGQVRYIGLGRFSQIAIMGAIALVIGWVGVASTRSVSSALVVAERNVRIATSDRVIRSMQAEIDGLKRELTSKDGAISKHAADKDQIAARDAALRAQIARLEQVRDQLIESHSARNSEIDRLNDKIGRLDEERGVLDEALQASRRELQSVVKERDRMVADSSELNERVAVLSDRLELYAASQSESINRLGERANQGISALERTLEVAGLDIPLMLERVLGDRMEELVGVGGPLLSLDDEPGSGAGEQLAAVEQRLLRLEGLQGLMKHLPLAMPMDEFRLTSGFGRRRDPFTNRLAMHPGLDFASSRKRPIYATAPGKVVFVGWNGGYGKVVEIDHGLGIRTRFAHLSRIYVKRGQAVEFREKIGVVGSTGRSTATHLHYEIMVDGQQLDPANFLRAGQYVFKN